MYAHTCIPICIRMCVHKVLHIKCVIDMVFLFLVGIIIHLLRCVSVCVCAYSTRGNHTDGLIHVRLKNVHVYAHLCGYQVGNRYASVCISVYSIWTFMSILSVHLCVRASVPVTHRVEYPQTCALTPLSRCISYFYF